MKVDISIGEILDKLSILSIKKNKIKEEKKLINIQKEFNQLVTIGDIILKNQKINTLYSNLLNINTELWYVEDKIREKEKEKIFDHSFIQLARSVYKLNDERANIKKQINILMSSDLIEEKSYNNTL